LDFPNYIGTSSNKSNKKPRERFLLIDVLHKYKIKTKCAEKRRAEYFRNSLNKKRTCELLAR